MPSGKRHYRLTVDEALAAHAGELGCGVRDGILDLGRIEAAVNRPYIGYYRSMAKKCAALTESLCCNHGFVDGNKRTCLFLVLLLLRHSDFDLIALHGEDRQDALENLLVDTAAGRLSFADLEAWFSARVRRRGTTTA